MNTRTQLFAGLALAAFATDAATAAATPAAPKAKTVAEDMEARRVFKDTDSASAYLNSLNESLSDFAETPLAFAGMGEDGDFDSAVYTEDTNVMVGVLRAGSKVKCVYILPIPPLDKLLAGEAGKSWVDRIILKELSHVGVRVLRTAEDISTVVDQMPTSLDAFISSARESGGIMETFNELYKLIGTTMAKNSGVWAKFKLTKPEMRRAFESKAYANEYYPALENRGEGKESLLVLALRLAVGAATKKGMDPTIFQRWLDTRDQKELTAADDDAENFDLDSMADDMLTEDTDAPATDADAEATA